MITRAGLSRLHAEERRRRVDPPTGALVTWRTGDTVHARTWPNALPHHKSPCRTDPSKGLRQHRCSPAHRAMVMGYRAWVRDAEQAAEAATLGYDTELAEYWETHPRPTLKAYLEGMRDETRHSAA